MVNKPGINGYLAKWLAIACAALLALAAGCQSAQEPPQFASKPLPALPDDGPAWTKAVSETTTISGADRWLDSGAPGAQPHPQQAEWLVLDGNVVSDMAWAIWRFPLTSETVIEEFRINLTSSGFSKYWLLAADFATGTWQLVEEKTGSSRFTPDPLWDMHSSGEYAYVAILVLPGNDINVTGIEQTVEGGGPVDPIFDQFENNDDTYTAYPLGSGIHMASVHETFTPEMSDPDEFQDFWDFYRISLQSGDYLVTTLYYEAIDHFDKATGNFNDLDLLFYLGETPDPLNDFIEQYSSTNIYYAPFEQSIYQASGSYDVIIGIRGELEGPDNNAEYEIGIHKAQQVYDVSGTITQEGSPVTVDYAALLVPGNFYATTKSDPADGLFTIHGVPNGTYQLKVHSSARYDSRIHPYVWPETEQVVVSNGSVSGAVIDIGPDPF